MPRAASVPCTMVGGEIVPHWLTERDEPWLRDLADAAETVAGQPFAKAARRLAGVVGAHRAGDRGVFATSVALAALPTAVAAPLPPVRVRAALARAMTREATPAAALQAAARELGLSPATVRAAMFADLSAERRVVPLPQPLPTSSLRLLANAAMARALLRRASAAELVVAGGVRMVVRQPQLSGAGVDVVAGAGGSHLRLRQGAGRALVGLLPLLPWCRRFQVHADVVMSVGRGRLVLRSGDPLPAGPPPAAADSAVERDFARAFAAAAPAWELLREPAAVAVDGALQFPDFAVRHRGSGRTFLLEIAAFHGAGYLQKKVRLLAALGDRLLLCVDARSAQRCGLVLPAAALLFRRRLDPRAVIAALTPRIDTIRSGRLP